MALTPSNMLALNTVAPEFLLNNPLDGTAVHLKDVQGQTGTLVMFICNHCPYVVHIIDVLAQSAKQYQQRGIGVVAINANDYVAYPADAPDKMKAFAHTHSFTFPYLLDEDQSVAGQYGAVCTPEFFLFDGEAKLVYHGRFDAATPGNDHAVTGEDLNDAVLQLSQRQPINSEQKPSLGCNIKWK